MTLQARNQKCKTCRQLCARNKRGKFVCSIDCEAAFGLVLADKNKRAENKRQAALDRAQLESMRPRKWWLAKAKKSLHAYIRARDEGKECISCDTVLVKCGRVGGDYDAGHFRSVGSAKHLEFVENNINGQCKHCNKYLSGSTSEYERRMRLRYSDSYVDDLLSDNVTRNLTIEDFRNIEAQYKLKFKELSKDKS